MSGLLVVLSGPSGVGKSTICGELVTKHPGITISTSMTTRPSRPGEKEGEDYFFVTREEFEQRIKDGYFLEWARVHGNYYGTPYDKVREKMAEGWDVLLEIDVQGALQVRNVFKEAVLIFVAPPSWQELETRIKERGTEEGEVVNERLRVACEEMKACSSYDYLVVNESLEEVVDKVASIVIAERCRVKNNS